MTMAIWMVPRHWSRNIAPTITGGDKSPQPMDADGFLGTLNSTKIRSPEGFNSFNMDHDSALTERTYRHQSTEWNCGCTSPPG